jgi:hypothetical protein
MRANPRAGPTSCATASQSASGSRVAKPQSVKSERASSKPTASRAAPVPALPWQVLQADR